MWASLPQPVRKPLVPSRKTAFGDNAKSLALRPRQRLCYFGAKHQGKAVSSPLG